MSQRTFVQCLVAITTLTLALVLWPHSKPQPVELTDDSPSSKVAESQTAVQTQAAATPSRGSLGRPLITSPVTVHPIRRAAQTESRVNATQLLAMVNHKEIKLRDLMPVKPDDTENELTPEQYAYRLQRAIEMELTLQAARDQKVELTAAQKERVKQIAQSDKADLEHYKQYGLTWSSSTVEQVEFEQRLLTAMLLELNLVAQTAGASPSPDPVAQARYEQARRTLLDQLQVAASVTMYVPSL